MGAIRYIQQLLGKAVDCELFFGWGGQAIAVVFYTK